MSEHLDRACAALMALTAAGEERVEGRTAEQTADLVDDAGEDLAAIVAEGPEGLAVVLELLDIAIGYAAAVSGESASFVARMICEVAKHPS